MTEDELEEKKARIKDRLDDLKKAGMVDDVRDIIKNASEDEIEDEKTGDGETREERPDDYLVEEFEGEDLSEEEVGIRTLPPDETLSSLVIPDDEELDIEAFKRRLEDMSVDSALPEEVEQVWEEVVGEVKPSREKPREVEEEVITAREYGFLTRLKRAIQGVRAPSFEDYDPQKHGPIVDTTPPDAPWEEVDLYPVNDPYAYIRIKRDPENHTLRYSILEPELSRGEETLMDEIHDFLVESMDVNLDAIAQSGAKQYLREQVDEYLANHNYFLDPVSRAKLHYYTLREFLGYGRIDPIMRDDSIEDISCDGPQTPIFVYHNVLESIETNIVFEDEDNLDSYIIRLAQLCGRHISIADPLLDGTLPDGSRIQMTLGREITPKGSTFTVRKFKENPLTPPDLVDLNTFNLSMVAYLWLAVESNRSIIFAGGTASGKTTTMNAISLFIPPETKIVSIEDTRELNLPHPNWIAGVTRETFGKKDHGQIDMYELLRAALRQRPEFLLVGEVRGQEAYVLFQAMSTGHTTFSTMHADSVTSVVHRLENPPINVPRIMLQSLDIVCIQNQVRVGGERVRRCRGVTEIIGVDPRSGELLTNEVFTWKPSQDKFQYSGRSYLLEEIMESRGWDEVQMREELKRRQEVLQWMEMKRVKHYQDVAKIVVAYYKEPDTLMEIVRSELYDS